MNNQTEIKEELNLVSVALVNARDVFVMLNSTAHSDAGLARVTYDALNKYYLELEKDYTALQESLTLSEDQVYLPWGEVKY